MTEVVAWSELVGPNATTRTLRSNHENRNLLVSNRFNTSYIDHTALLWYIFLCTDTSTIAAMIFTVEGVGGRGFTNVDGQSFDLSRYRCSQLFWVASLGLV
jgi:hypothetical protein